MQTGYLSKTRMKLNYRRLLSLTRLLQSPIRNLQSMAVLPGVLGYSFDSAQNRLPLRRTVQVRLGSSSLRVPDGTAISKIAGHQFMK